MAPGLQTTFSNPPYGSISVFEPVIDGSGHETAAVLLPGFAISW